MTARTIRLPNGNRCTLGIYVKSWRALLAAPPDATIGGFFDFPAKPAEVLCTLRAGLHDRINRHDPRYGVGRKWSSDWQRHALQCALAVNTPCLVVRWVPPEFRSRLARRLTID